MGASRIKMMGLHSWIGGSAAQKGMSGLRTDWRRGRYGGDDWLPTMVAMKLLLSPGEETSANSLSSSISSCSVEVLG